MSKRNDAKLAAAKQELNVHLPDTRGVTISRWGRGNTKLGMDGVYTYSRLPGRPDGRYESVAFAAGFEPGTSTGTCPGSTEECESICYAKRVIDTPPVWDVWARNSLDTNGAEVLAEPLPSDAKIVRIHVSGDFDTPLYIQHWIKVVLEHPDVLFFGYTRSWRVPELLFDLNRLRALPNVELFASMDKSIAELPPQGWRRAWIENDSRIGRDVPSYVCPEQTGRKANCQECGYCIVGRKNDVTFLLH